MTLDEFFEKLPRDGWAIWNTNGDSGAICRADDQSVCPRLYVGGTLDGGWRQIYRAADNDPDCDRPLRARLLAHCGLAELEARRK